MKKSAILQLCFFLATSLAAVAQDAPSIAGDGDDLPARMAAATPQNPFENSLGMKFVHLQKPAYDFQSPGEILLFSIWDTRVMDYRAYADAAPGVDGGWMHPSFKQGDDHPVVNVNYNEAQAFCAWLTKKERQERKIAQALEYRLPTGDEWELMAGGAIYPWGDQWPPPDGVGNYGPRFKLDGYANTSPAGSFKPNRYGFYDLGGNVWQWCADWTDDSKQYHPIHGAAWNVDEDVKLKVVCAGVVKPEIRTDYIGFRCVLALVPAGAFAQYPDKPAATPAPPASQKTPAELLLFRPQKVDFSMVPGNLTEKYPDCVVITIAFNPSSQPAGKNGASLKASEGGWTNRAMNADEPGKIKFVLPKPDLESLKNTLKKLPGPFGLKVNPPRHGYIETKHGYMETVPLLSPLLESFSPAETGAATR